MLKDKKILIIISGGIAAYKALDLIRLLRKENAHVRCILTQGGAQFITPLSVASLSGEKVYTDLWSLTDETEMGHIRLSRETDLILIAPASADLLAKMACGLANDLASTTLLASDKPIIAAPAMNPMMWKNEATQVNIETLKKRGVGIIGPAHGDMACGENGEGRLLEPQEIVQSVKDFFFDRPLKGYNTLVTSGPTHEPIDPVRYLGNRSSGKQGHAIASALRDAGANVTLVTGPVALPPPHGINVISVQTAQDMCDACVKTQKIDIAICAAAVSDWRVNSQQDQKIKKSAIEKSLSLELTQTPDILQALSMQKQNRPKLVIGFAAETQDVVKNGQEKIKTKGCDWILANQVGTGLGFGTDENIISLITKNSIDSWPQMTKTQIAQKLTTAIIAHFKS